MNKTLVSPAVQEHTTRGRSRQSRAARAVEIIKQRIKCGTYSPGQQLPSIRALSTELGMTHRVIQRAVQNLEGEGIVESRHGVGTRVRDDADCLNTALLMGFVQPYFSRYSLALQEYLEDTLDKRSNLCWMKSSHNDPERERREIERLLASGVNGLLIWPVDGDTNGAFLQEVARRVPVVFVDRTLPDVSAPSVVTDFANGGRKILRHLYNANKQRVLVVCDPVNISTFNQLKAGLRQEAVALGIEDCLTIFDFPLIRLIESSYKEDFRMTDECYETLAPLIVSGEFDALFCPQSEFFDLVFAEADRVEVLRGLHLVTTRIPECPPHSRRYHQMGIQEWIMDTPQMLVQALDLLQDITLKRATSRRNIRLPLTLRSKSSDSAN